MNAKQLREKIAKNEFYKPTSGYCTGQLQANMLAIPSAYADAFEAFAQANKKAIPVLEIIKGSHYSKELARGANLLNELSAYNIIKDGVVVETVNNIEGYYRDDLVFFLIGCSFTFETSLMNNGISLRHVDLDLNVSMYNTTIELNPFDMFKGKMVVSMRPVKKYRVADACVITSHYPSVHGSPIQVGYPDMIGINELDSPEYGDKVEVKDDEIPLFWPCGVTTQKVLEEIKIPFAITHAPGFMFVSDKLDSEYYN